MTFPSRFRRIGIPAAVLLLSLVLCLLSTAQDTSTAITGPVTIDPIDQVTVARGSDTLVAITLHIQNGFHINSNKPRSNQLKPTEMHVSVPEALILTHTHYPEGKLSDSPFDAPGEKLSLYSGDVTITTRLRARSKSMLGGYTVHGDLVYQACDNRSCFPPKMLPFEFMVNVVRAPRNAK